MNISPLTLKSCQRITITTGVVGPGDVTVDAPSPGPGVINVSGPGGNPQFGAVSVPSGGPQTVHAPDASLIVLHYIKDATGTDSIDIDLSVV